MDDFSKLEPTKHMLDWFAAEPFGAIRNEVETILQQQETGSQLKMFDMLDNSKATRDS